MQGTASELKNIETARNALQRKQESLSDGKITSPIDGTVTRVNINVGRFADETDDKKPMFVVENLQQLQKETKITGIKLYGAGNLTEALRYAMPKE